MRSVPSAHSPLFERLLPRNNFRQQSRVCGQAPEHVIRRYNSCSLTMNERPATGNTNNYIVTLTATLGGALWISAGMQPAQNAR
jgi:hypothetical protein